MENRVERAPDYTEGEREWMVSELIINNVRRSDDDLYECQARNEGGKYFKTGHIQVQQLEIFVFLFRFVTLSRTMINPLQ